MPNPPFDLNVYEYEKGGYYPEFKAAVDEKICAAMVAGTLASSLRDEGLVYNNTGGSIPVADIGCGPADSIQMYLGAARHEGGFDIHATDYSKDYTGPDGAAGKNLLRGRSSGKLKINSFSVTNGDAFDGNLNTTMGTEPNHFPLAFISHMFYHTNPENLGTMLSDVSNNMLTTDGVGVLFHLEEKPDTFQHFRSKYGRRSVSEGSSDTPAMEVTNPPEAVEAACRAAEIPCHTAHYSNNYYFAPMEEKNWEMFKHPEQYHLITDEAALGNLRKLYFIVQRAANEFASDHSATGLSAYIDEVKALIAPDQAAFEKDGAFMKLAETVQLIGSTKATAATKEKIERVSASIQGALPALEAAAFAEWERGQSRAASAA